VFTNTEHVTIYTKSSSENLKEGENLGELGVDKDKCKIDFKEHNRSVDYIHLGRGFFRRLLGSVAGRNGSHT
jgi:hypothetical protein